ncbi:GNAT family N-acetyltransferase [Bacillus sp. FJAT-28004]|uniref:GNAT family N-acetyltransferase n=1 Tax=Bacillus sp. FJAT-28004 TaxID=1679165 RepID=UPI0006B47620|nr:GNAT family N-acetyltransferase [Bacillus sp. FJAT-28004]
MRKELYLFIDGKPQKAIIRHYNLADFEGLIHVQRLSFPPPYPQELWWNKDQLTEHVTRFPEGAICAEVDGSIIGSMTGLRIDMNEYGHDHNWETISDSGYIRNHKESGDTLYVIDLCVIPEYRKSGIGKWLMQSMYETVVQLGLLRLLGGGRMPGYGARSHQISPEEYLDKVMQGEWKDPVITFLLKCGRMPIGVAHNYLDDEQSHNCAAIMEWRNPFK